MSFDALTIAGILTVIVVGGFLLALASRNDSRAERRRKAAEADNNG